MKFFTGIIVAFAMLMNSQASYVPLALRSPLIYAGPSGLVNFYNSHSVFVQEPTILKAATPIYPAPLALPVGLNAEGTYIAKTLGSEHIASLPGHLHSASSINLEQAPGVEKEEVKYTSSLAPSVAVHGSVIPAALPLSLPSVVVPPTYVIPSEAKYVAKNLGVEHVASLPGHILSATSLNLEPAPGSK